MLTRSVFPIYKSYLSTLWKGSSAKLLSFPEKQISVYNLEIVRYRARKGTRAAALAAKKARKLQQVNKPAPIPKFLQRKVKLSPEHERVRCTDENWLQSQPVDNVWNMKLYRGKPYAISEAINILKDMHVPALLNDPSALIYITAEIDLKLKKNDRFMDEFSGIITFPNEFETVQKNRIAVVCKSEEDQTKAIEAGAIYTGSATLIKQILSGTLSTEDFDYIICHPDMYKELNSLRGILKRKYPTIQNGMLRLDIDKAVTSFIKGVEYKMKRSSIELDFGWVDVCFGRLNMPVMELEENLKHALNTIEKHKPTGTGHILFIIRALLSCEKSREKIKIPHWECIPKYPVNGILIEEKEDENETQAKTAT